MSVIHIGQNEFDDFMDEPDTDPFIKIVEKQLNGSTSIAGFAAAARNMTKRIEEQEKRQSWIERLDQQLSSTDPIFEEKR